MSSPDPRGRAPDETTPFVVDGHRDVSEERIAAPQSFPVPTEAQYSQTSPARNHRIEKDCQKKPTATHIPWRHKISLMNTLLIALVALLVPAAVGFLAFLWSYTGGGSVNSTFRSLVVGNWIVQAVTITSVVLRFAVSTAAGIATSMLAALALEIQGVNIRSAASVSILRFVNSGPSSLLLDLKHTWIHNWRSSATVLLLFLTTLLLQFTSTLLTSDLSNGILTGPAARNTTNTRITQNNLDLSGVEVSLSGTPREYPLFAELHTLAATISDSVRDTGTLLRGLLPLPSSTTRISIEAFSGQSTILDSRVVCLRPQMNKELTVVYDVKRDYWLFNGTWTPEVGVEGLLPADFIPNHMNNKDTHLFDLEHNNATFARYSTQIYNTTNDGSQTEAYAEMLPDYQDIFSLGFFESAFQVPVSQNSQAWTLSFMPFDSGPVLLSALDPRYPFTSINDAVEPASRGNTALHRLPRYRQNDSITLLTGSSYFVLNITNESLKNMPTWNTNASATLDNNQFPAYIFATYEQGFAKLVTSKKNEWLTFSLSEYPGWEASISLCYDSSIAMDLQVNMTTDKPITKPTLGVFNETTKHFGTEQILAQLNYSRAQIDTMNLSISVTEIQSQISPSYQKALQRNVTTMDIQNWVPSFVKNAVDVRYFYIMCEDCTASDTTPTRGDFSGGSFGQYNHDTNGVYVTGGTQQIFMDVVQSTGNVGLAISDYMTVVARSLYYDALPYFDLPDEATIHLFESGLYPKRFTGLAIVLAALLIHICIVTSVTIIFLTRTRVSRIGDTAWQAVAQVQFQQLQDLLPEAVMASDEVFEKRIADAGLGNDIASFSSAQYENKKVV